MNLSSSDHTNRSPATQGVEAVAPIGLTVPLSSMNQPKLVVMAAAVSAFNPATVWSPCRMYPDPASP
jgi:hypothetical protein